MLTIAFESQAHFISPRYLTAKHSFSYFQIGKANVYHYDLEVFPIFFLEPILQVLLLYLTNNARWEVILSGIPPRQLCSFCISSALSFPERWASKTIGTVPSLRVSSPGPPLHCFLPWLPPQKANTRVQPVSHISKAAVLNDIVLS